jgi:putative tryptophan/tyrosine transport system substrate-binding protein
MKRREFIAGLGSAVAGPVAAWGQQGERVRRVGVLTYGFDTGTARGFWLDHLAQLGWTEGRNLWLDFRFGNGDARMTNDFAADLLQLAPDVIVAVYLVALRALQQQTKTIQVVFVGGGDAIEIRTVINSARPEGNVTGFTNVFGSLGGKWLELLKEVCPNIARVGYLYDPRSGRYDRRGGSLGNLEDCR